MKFKTNIRCVNCKAAVKPYLDKLAGEDGWNVDLSDPYRILTVEGGEAVSAESVREAVGQAGFRATPLPE